jgi:hypothetical protein
MYAEKNIIILHNICKMSLGELSEAMGGIELSEPLKPEIVRLIQMALYYDFVLYNMQQKPFYVLLSVHGGAMKNMDRSTMTELYRIDPNTIHAALARCLKSKSQCDTADLGRQVKAIKEMYDDKINGFKAVTKTTPAKLYDLLNPGDGDINVAIQKAAREIMAYSPSQSVLYLGDDDEVFQLIFKDAAVGFLDHETVEAIRSIMEPEIALPPKRKGGRRTRQRGTRRHGPKRHNRRSYKNTKRTRRH